MRTFQKQVKKMDKKTYKFRPCNLSPCKLTRSIIVRNLIKFDLLFFVFIILNKDITNE